MHIKNQYYDDVNLYTNIQTDEDKHKKLTLQLYKHNHNWMGVLSAHPWVSLHKSKGVYSMLRIQSLHINNI